MLVDSHRMPSSEQVTVWQAVLMFIARSNFCNFLCYIYWTRYNLLRLTVWWMERRQQQQLWCSWRGSWPGQLVMHSFWPGYRPACLDSLTTPLLATDAVRCHVKFPPWKIHFMQFSLCQNLLTISYYWCVTGEERTHPTEGYSIQPARDRRIAWVQVVCNDLFALCTVPIFDFLITALLNDSMPQLVS